MNRLFANVCSSNLSKAKLFYTELFGFEVKFDSDWFVHLGDPANSSLELGLIAKDHELVPESARGQSSGIYITLVVGDVDLIYRKAQELKVKIIDPPTPTFYGQKRMLLQDPDGNLLDVSSLYNA